MDEKMTFKIFDENGNATECEVLFTFDSEETEKNYIVYTDNTKDDEGNTKVYASIYHPEDPTKLDPITTDKEWKIISMVLDEVMAEAKKEVGNEGQA